MATEKLWTGFDNTKIMAERAVCDEVGQNIVDTYATKSGVPSVYNAKLKLQLGSGQSTDTGFTANASADATLTVPEMVGASQQTAGSSGLVPAPAAGDEEKLLTGDGNWTAFENDVFGTQLLDEHDQPVLDEESTPSNPIYVYDANSTDELLTGFAGKGFGAIRAYADQDGNNIKSTYATKDELPSTMTGATAQSAGTSGLVPAPAAGDQGKFLKGNGTWDTPIFDKNYSFIWDGSPSEVYGMFQVSIGRDQYGYSGAPRKLTQVGRSGALGFLLPEPIDGTIPVSVNDAGNNNCYALKTPAQLGLLSAINPTASDVNKVLSVNAQGTPVWKAFDSDVFGTQLLDEHDQPVLDEESTPGNPIYVYDASSTDQLWTGFAGKGFGAIRAYADQDGNNIKETYVKHADVPDMDEASTNDIDAMFNISGQAIIGGHRYKTVTIGNQEWLAENLDYKFAYNGGTLPLNVDGAPTTPAAWYYQRNEREYGTEGIYNCGLYYNWYAVKYLDDNTASLLSDGWHVATEDDWDTLVRTLGYTPSAGTAYCGHVLSAKNNSVTSDWPSNWNGTDDYGFNITPCGARAYGDSEWYSRFGLDAYFWTPSALGNYRYMVSVYNDGKFQLGTAGSSTWTGGYPIRLVRTIP